MQFFIKHLTGNVFICRGRGTRELAQRLLPTAARMSLTRCRRGVRRRRAFVRLENFETPRRVPTSRRRRHSDVYRRASRHFTSLKDRSAVTSPPAVSRPSVLRSRAYTSHPPPSRRSAPFFPSQTAVCAFHRRSFIARKCFSASSLCAKIKFESGQ